MKTQIISMRSNGIFKVSLSILFCLYTIIAQADIVDHIFDKTLEVNEKVTVKTNGMEIPRLDFSGWVSSSKVKGAYTLKTREQLFLKVHKGLNINTWNQSQIRHVVKVTVRAETPQIERSFLNDLEHALTLNATENIELDNMLGIKAIMMKNGWLRGIDNTVTTANGNEYKLDYLEISAELFIPENSNLEIVDAHFTDFLIGKLNGILTVELEGGSVKGTYIQEVNAWLNSSEVRLSEVDLLDVSAHQSKININKVNDCTIGKLPFEYDAINFGALNHGVGSPLVPIVNIGSNKEHNSTINKYKFDDVNRLKIASSANDKIDVINLNDAELLKTNFTDLTISTLNGSMTGAMSFGELDIFTLNTIWNNDFELESFNGTLRIYSRNIKDLELNIITNKVKPEVMLHGKSPKEHQQLLNNVGENLIHIGDDYILLENESNNRSTNKSIYRKGTKKQNGSVMKIFCNNCDLTIR